MNGDYFYANACHVCKKIARFATKLTKCRKCNMISYCSAQHMLQDKQNHANLCSAIMRYYIRVNRKGIPTTKKVPNILQWFYSKYHFMTAIRKILKRPLMRFEKQMFMFPSSCVTCHKQEDLSYCKCATANFCHEHLDKIEHCQALCERFQECYVIDIYDFVKDGIHSVDMSYLKDLPNDRYFQLFEYPLGIIDFYRMYINPYVNVEPYARYMIEIDYHTEKASMPLTLLFAMQVLNYTDIEKTLKIHIITNEFPDEESFHVWEILLHFIPHVTDLHILLIGPKLQFLPFRYYNYLCEKCRLREKKLSYASVPFFRRVIEVHKPHLIISFNARIYEGKATHINPKTYDYTSDINNWKDILQCLSDLRVSPLILTCYNKIEAVENVWAIDLILNKVQNNFFITENRFFTFKSYRNPETETVLMQNDYLIAYSSFSRDEISEL